MTELEKYYNKFNEEKRLKSRHGQVEFRISMKYIEKCLNDLRRSVPDASQIKILDVGAGTGRYSVALAGEGYDVSAIEPVRYNLGILKQKHSSVKAFQGNALKLSRFEDSSFDLTLLFGPLYHLFKWEEKKQALLEAKRVTKENGYILVAYCMNEYSVITYAFKEHHIQECMADGRLTQDFKTVPNPANLYDYMRLEDINRLNSEVMLKRVKILSPDGISDYIRPCLNQLSEEEFEYFVKYQASVCERSDLIGAGSHTLDILKK